MAPLSPQPFTINVPDSTLEWIQNRVNSSRLPTGFDHGPGGNEFDYGVPRSVIDPIVEYWKTSYDWRKVEEDINRRIKMFTVEIESSGENINLHFLHHRSERKDAIPLLFAHGWPGNFLEVT